MLHYMTTRQAPKLLSTSVTSTLKKSGLHCEAGSFNTGGFRASQVDVWRDGYKRGIESIVVRFRSGFMMNSPENALAKATDALIAKGYSVKVNQFNELVVTVDSDKDGE